MNPIPVLMYHFINNNVNDIVTISPDDFLRQIDYLKENNFHVLTVDECVMYLKGNKNPPKKSVVITFDDGRLDFFVHAYPILERYNIPATVFVIPGRCPGGNIIRRNKTGHATGDIKNEVFPFIRHHNDIKKDEERVYAPLDDYISWAEMNLMKNKGLIDFQSHTMFHKRLSVKGRNSLNLDDINIELKKSKDEIEKRLNKPCNYIAWPKGNYGRKVIESASNLGYKAAFTTDYGVNYPGQDLMKIKRIPVKEGSISWFKKRMKIFTSKTLSLCYLTVNRKKGANE